MLNKSTGSLDEYQPTCSEGTGRVPGRLGVSVTLSQLCLFQVSRVLNQEHQAAYQHLSVEGLRLHLEGVYQEVDNPGLEVVKVGEGDTTVSPRHQLLDGHVGKVEREAKQGLQQVDPTPPQVTAVDRAEIAIILIKCLILTQHYLDAVLISLSGKTVSRAETR